ncbi:MAG TPA: STAS domain-containing protein, partial [Rhodothermales bacterium]|nr:STAS domain-containing protein [Rhodothermales bacterium]
QLAQGVKKFVLDFTDTGSLDSTGLGAIFSVYRQVNPRGGQVALASLSRPVQTVVRLSGSYKVFPQFASVTDATAA